MPGFSRTDPVSHLPKRSNSNSDWSDSGSAAAAADASADRNTNANTIMQWCAPYDLEKKQSATSLFIIQAEQKKKERKRNWCVALDPLGPTSGM